jgi:hypothetical protein
MTMLRRITATLMAIAVALGGALMAATFGAVKAPGRSRSPAHADGVLDDNVRFESPGRRADRRQALARREAQITAALPRSP